MPQSVRLKSCQNIVIRDVTFHYKLECQIIFFFSTFTRLQFIKADVVRIILYDW